MSLTPSILGNVECNQKRRVLIVDNDEEAQQLLRRILENMGLETRTTWSGYEALSLIQSGSLDVLLVDDYLPDLHCHEFLARVGRLPAQPWIVVMQATVPTRKQLLQYAMLGAIHVVRKHHLAELSRAVSSCCGGYPPSQIDVN